MYGSEARCVKDSEIRILRRAERSMENSVCAVQLKNVNIPRILMLMLGWTLFIYY